MKLLILVLSYDDNGGIYSQFHQTQKNTWDSLVVDGVETYYYFGNSDKNSLEGKEIRVVDKENENCIDKLITTLKIINEFDFDILFRTNSSSYVDKEKLYNFLLGPKKNNFYSGIIGTYDNLKFGSGAGFCLSKDLVNLIIENENLIDKNLIDDLSVANFLKKFDITPIDYGFTRWDLGYSKIDDPNFLNYYHYRLKTPNKRNFDIEFMKRIYNLKIK